MEEKKNTLSLISMILAIVCAVVFLLYPDQNTLAIELIIIGVLSIVSLVLGIIAKKQIAKTDGMKGRSMATTGIVISIILMVLCGISGYGLAILNNQDLRNQYVCPMTTDCVDNEDNTSTCIYFNTEVICTTDKLDEANYEKSK